MDILVASVLVLATFGADQQAVRLARATARVDLNVEAGAGALTRTGSARVLSYLGCADLGNLLFELRQVPM
jgi:hypothetical protein